MYDVKFQIIMLHLFGMVHLYLIQKKYIMDYKYGYYAECTNFNSCYNFVEKKIWPIYISKKNGQKLVSDKYYIMNIIHSFMIIL